MFLMARWRCRSNCCPIYGHNSSLSHHLVKTLSISQCGIVKLSECVVIGDWKWLGGNTMLGYYGNLREGRSADNRCCQPHPPGWHTSQLRSILTSVQRTINASVGLLRLLAGQTMLFFKALLMLFKKLKFTMWYTIHEPFHPKHHKEGNCPEITLFMSAGSPTLINNSPLLGLFLWEPLLTTAAVASHNVTLVPLKSIFTHHIIFQILGWPQEPLKHDQLHHSLIVEKYENHSVNWVQFRPLFKLSLSLVNWD